MTEMTFAEIDKKYEQQLKEDEVAIKSFVQAFFADPRNPETIKREYDKEADNEEND